MAKKIFKPARDESAAPDGVETKTLILDTGFDFLTGSVLGYHRWLVSSVPLYYTSPCATFCVKNFLRPSSASWGAPKGFCWVQPGFSCLFLNEQSQNGILVLERESFKLHTSTADCALCRANSVRQRGGGLRLWKWPLNTMDLRKDLGSYRAELPPHQSTEGWQG